MLSATSRLCLPGRQDGAQGTPTFSELCLPPRLSKANRTAAQLQFSIRCMSAAAAVVSNAGRPPVSGRCFSSPSRCGIYCCRCEPIGSHESLDSALLSAANSIDAIPQAGTDRPRPTCSGVHRAASFCHGRRGPSSTPPARPRLAAAAQCIWHACPCIHVRRAHERVIHLRVRCNVPSPIGRICAQIGTSNVFASQRWLPRDTGLPVVHRERWWLRV